MAPAMRRAGWSPSGRVVQELARRAESEGIELRLGRVERLVEGGVRLDGGELRADAVVVAGGTWTWKLLPELAGRMWSTAQTIVHLHVDPATLPVGEFPPWCADKIGRAHV